MNRFKCWSIALFGLGLAAMISSRSFAEPIDEKHQKSIDKGLEWLKKTQQKDGTWSTGGQNPVSMTAMAGLAMLCEGSTVSQGKYREEIRKAADWLMKRSMKGGGRNGLIGNPDHPGETGRYMYGHGFAMLFLASVYGEEEDKERRAELKDILTRAVLYCGSAQSTQGGWFYTSKTEGHDSDEGSVTVTQMQGMRACRDAGIPVPKEIMQKGAEYLRKSTAADNGVVYSLGRGGIGMPAGGGRPALTAAAIACLFSNGNYKDAYVKKWFTYCYDPNRRDNEQKIPIGGPGGARAGFDEYTHFYYSASIYFIGEDGYQKMFPDTPKDKALTWSKYKNAYFEGIVRSQSADGSFAGAGGWGSGPIYATAVYCIMMQLDNNCLPVFQR
jgi:hypothetical protein